MNLTLSDNEAQVLTGLIDIAVKSAGLQVAEAAVALTRKIATAAQAAQAEQSKQAAQSEQAAVLVANGVPAPGAVDQAKAAPEGAAA